MQLVGIQEMPIEELKADFMSIMSEIVTQHGDDKSEQSTESTDTKAVKV